MDKNILKQSIMYRVLFVVMFIGNGLYVGGKLYGYHITKDFSNGDAISESTASLLHSIWQYTAVFETVFIWTSFIGALMIFTWKYRFLLKSYLLMQLAFFIVLGVINSALAWIFSVDMLNMLQNLFYPFVFLLAVFIYFLFKNIFRAMNKASSTS